MNAVLDATQAVTPAQPFVPTDSQRRAIEAELGPVLVLAGPGAGKTYCLKERIRYLIDHHGLDPARICAFTFTNKAADEIGSRISRDLGAAGEHVKRGTIHAFCAEVLREFGEFAGLPRGYGIADEDYQLRVLARLGVPARFQPQTLRSFSLHRLRGFTLASRDERRFEKYMRHLEKRNLVDFDGLVLKTRELLEREPRVADALRSRWDYVLVDEFQDLNPAQYAVVHELARGHGNVFAVGDVEQSIFSWTGADPRLFKTFINDFEVARTYTLDENHRCPSNAFELARRLVEMNDAELGERPRIRAERHSDFPVEALSFDADRDETAWLLGDLRRDRSANYLRWDQCAILYRKHEVGSALETSLVTAGIPCRLAQGRALADDPVVAYLLAALRVIAAPRDTIPQELFLKIVLPAALWAGLETRAHENRERMIRQVLWEARRRARHDEDARKLARGLFALKNLEALGRKHVDLVALIEELLSQRVGEYRSALEERHHDLSDPLDNHEVVRLSTRLAAAVERRATVWIEPMGGLEIPLRRMLEGAGVASVAAGGPRPPDAEPLLRGDVPSLGIALGTFKALQLLVSRRVGSALKDYTAVDIETTDRDTIRAEIVSIAAVRVRGGRIVGQYESLVRPRVPITAAATAVHKLTTEMVADARWFEAVWPEFRDFCGDDILVAHNGALFDFPILRRMAKGLGGDTFCTYDTLLLARELHTGSRKLENLAYAYGIDHGQAHQVLDDARTLAQVCLRLEDDRLARARKTALVNLLDHLGVALALSDEESLGEEALELRGLSRVFALGRYTDALDLYRADRDAMGDPTVPDLDELIARLGGADLMTRIRAERRSDDRYPAAMARIRRLIATKATGTLAEQIGVFLEQVALSARSDGAAVGEGRVNLLTLHSTKGLEFSRVYIVGVEDAELPGGSPMNPCTVSEVEEGRRVLYVGMTRAMDRLVMTRVGMRGGRPTGGHQFLAEMGLPPRPPLPSL
jgi:superfamily I DNA/RNA helicase